MPAQLETLAGFWLALGAIGLLHWREDFTPRALKPWLGNLALLEPVVAGGFCFRLCGSYLGRRFGCDATGKQITDLPVLLRADLRDRLDRATALQAPILARVHIHAGDESIEYCDLILPLSSRETSTRLLLLASYPLAQATEVPGPLSAASRTRLQGAWVYT